MAYLRAFLTPQKRSTHFRRLDFSVLVERPDRTAGGCFMVARDYS